MQVDPEKLTFAIEYSMYLCVTKSMPKLRYGPSNTMHFNRAINLLIKARNEEAVVYKTAVKSYILGLFI